MPSWYCIITDDSLLFLKCCVIHHGSSLFTLSETHFGKDSPDYTPWHNRRGHNFCFSKSQGCPWQDWYISILILPSNAGCKTYTLLLLVTWVRNPFHPKDANNMYKWFNFFYKDRYITTTQ